MKTLSIPLLPKDLVFALLCAVLSFSLAVLLFRFGNVYVLAVAVSAGFGALVLLVQVNFRRAGGSVSRVRLLCGEICDRLDSLEKLRCQLDVVLYDVLSADLDASDDPVARARRGRPSSIIPSSLLEDYTLAGQIPVERWYFDNVQKSEKSTIFTREVIDSFVRKAQMGESVAYGETSVWLYAALQKYPVQGLDVAVMGSVSPHFESVCLAYGGQPTTIEYSTIVSHDLRVNTFTVEEFRATPRSFDAAFSISSFEHDGLGRYGDPLNPVGDLQAMQSMKSIVKPGGFLFLAVPVGRDRLVWNAHRIYGSLRLPMLLRGWEVIERFGWSAETIDLYPGHTQPVLVLRNV